MIFDTDPRAGVIKRFSAAAKLQHNILWINKIISQAEGGILFGDLLI